MNLKIITTLLISIVTTPLIWAVGPGGDAGGDSIVCKQDQEAGFPEAGLYSLDYALTVKKDDATVDKDFSFYKLVERIEKLNFAPGFVQRLKVFAASRANPDNLSPYLWNDDNVPQNSVNDEGVQTLIPDSCRTVTGRSKSERKIGTTAIIEPDMSPGQATLYQVTVRTPKQARRVIEFKTYTRNLARLNKLQSSYHWLHEFLQDYTSNRETIRRANRFLHRFALGQSEIETEGDFISKLSQLGLGRFLTSEEQAQLEKKLVISENIELTDLVKNQMNADFEEFKNSAHAKDSYYSLYGSCRIAGASGLVEEAGVTINPTNLVFSFDWIEKTESTSTSVRAMKKTYSQLNNSLPQEMTVVNGTYYQQILSNPDPMIFLKICRYNPKACEEKKIRSFTAITHVKINSLTEIVGYTENESGEITQTFRCN